MSKATEKMLEFAQDIADELDLEMPDSEDFDEIKEFIEENKDDFYFIKNFKD